MDWMKMFVLLEILMFCTAENERCLNTSKTSDDFTFLYNYLNGTGLHNFSNSITVGFLSAYGQAQVVLGALPLAVDAVNKDKGT